MDQEILDLAEHYGVILHNRSKLFGFPICTIYLPYEDNTDTGLYLDTDRHMTTVWTKTAVQYIHLLSKFHSNPEVAHALAERFTPLESL